MQDPRFDQLADVLINHSTKLQAGENLLIEATDVPEELTVAIIRAAEKVGGNVMVNTRQSRVTRALFQAASEDSMKLNGAVGLHQMQQAQAYIAIRGGHNSAEMSDIPGDKMKLYTKHWMHPVHLEHRVKKTRWCVLRYPSPSMAQEAQSSTEAFEKFFFDVCTFDYSRMERAVQPLVELMQRTDRVQITGPGTDLRFSIKDIGVIPCYGTHNIPDGECFTAPVKDSVEGTIQFNTPTIEHGVTHDNVLLTFKDGKIIEATGSNTKKLNEVLDTDDGARYIGEFSLAYNPYILQPMKDILFDEKIAGSFHFTPGQAYEDADNGNRSEVHWDMVCIQREEFGGGEIYFDGKLIRKNGIFVVPELEGLNIENLKGV
ncbi:aminopeptidase [Abditibacterium utsteinense]|uniref:Aminopeptidase n=1 Tax=Abditibacterium utsteinense TaxID=1960156 RepID=A0A2S8SVE3_9BACT|nr:aminopeptidase [Abditibacterium utsteinense]PQV64751.1 aminopeptidase [Abditibacterium utsteinense]